MSVRDINKILIISDTLNGEIIDSIKIDNYNQNTINCMIEDIVDRYCFDNEHGFMVKVGYNN